jgi:hypothetical protein
MKPVRIPSQYGIRKEWKKQEKIAHEAGDPVGWICMCKNTPSKPGFYMCDRAGNHMEPTIGNNWNYLYACDQCGRFIV